MADALRRADLDKGSRATTARAAETRTIPGRTAGRGSSLAEAAPAAVRPVSVGLCGRTGRRGGTAS